MRGPLLLVTMMVGGMATFLLNVVLYPLFYWMDPMMRPAHACVAKLAS